MNDLYRIIEFPVKHGNCGGSLIQFQPGDEAVDALPFEIGKVLVSWDMRPDDVRGNHAHHATEEIVVALSGGCTFDLDDGKGNLARVRLSTDGCRSLDKNDPEPRIPHPASRISYPEPRTPNPASRIPHPDTRAALLLYPHIWRTFHDFEPGTTLLLVANMKYDEADYIRDRERFEELARDWSGLGGNCG